MTKLYFARDDAFEGSTPLQVVERGESDRLWRMIWELRMGIRAIENEWHSLWKHTQNSSPQTFSVRPRSGPGSLARRDE